MDNAGGVAVKLVLFNARETDVQKQHSVVFSLLYNVPRKLSVVCIREHPCLTTSRPFVKGHKGLHTCTLLNVWGYNCRPVHHACMTHVITWTNTLLE